MVLIPSQKTQQLVKNAEEEKWSREKPAAVPKLKFELSEKSYLVDGENYVQLMPEVWMLQIFCVAVLIEMPD